MPPTAQSWSTVPSLHSKRPETLMVRVWPGVSGSEKTQPRWGSRDRQSWRARSSGWAGVPLRAR